MFQFEKYDKANRTGCALLYLGQMSSGRDKEQYLQKAIEGFSDWQELSKNARLRSDHGGSPSKV